MNSRNRAENVEKLLMEFMRFLFAWLVFRHSRERIYTYKARPKQAAFSPPRRRAGAR